ncbi:hypothetical protein ACH49O_40825 [Streptomyces coeruleorubidus]|uniref:hypothetical protein n=1 Tax=Streptomyces coeruleorubidus TaxID=116188 RepID=UPI0033EE3C65
MANDDSENSHEPSEHLDSIWGFLGLAAGLAACLKLVYAFGLDGDDEVPSGSLIPVAVLALALTVGPMIISRSISERLRGEVKRGKISYATYWTTLIGITGAVFSLLGIVNIDEYIEVWKNF